MCCCSSSALLLYCCVAILFSYYLKLLSLCEAIVRAVSGKYCHCYCQYMSGLPGLWAKNITCVYRDNSPQDRKAYHILLVKTGKHIMLGREGWPNPLIPTDMDEYEGMSLCEHMTCTQCLCVLCPGTCDRLRACGSCLCLLMCNRSQSVVHEVRLLFIEITAPCAAYCVCEVGFLTWASNTFY